MGSLDTGLIGVISIHPLDGVNSQSSIESTISIFSTLIAPEKRHASGPGQAEFVPSVARDCRPHGHYVPDRCGLQPRPGKTGRERSEHPVVSAANIPSLALHFVQDRLREQPVSLSRSGADRLICRTVTLPATGLAARLSINSGSRRDICQTIIFPAPLTTIHQNAQFHPASSLAAVLVFQLACQRQSLPQSWHPLEDREHS